jgi:hypothetical protein
VGPTAGFPHSDIVGSWSAHDSPTLFAVCHVLHRLLTPRHPPFAFSRLSRHTETAHHLYVCLARMLLPIRLLRYVVSPLANNTMGLSRLERLTSPLSEECSNRLSYRPDANRRLGRGLRVRVRTFQNTRRFTSVKRRTLTNPRDDRSPATRCDGPPPRRSLRFSGGCAEQLALPDTP